MRFYRSNRLFQLLFQRCIWQKPGAKKTVYLTFDDGPTPAVTPFVLEQLERFNAKATFFCVGENVERYPELYASVLNAGHSTGNHTYSHLSAWQTNSAKWRADFEKAEALISSYLMRPPYGKLTWKLQRYLVKKGYSPIMWSFITYDFDHRSNPHIALKALKRRKRNGEIVVMHDQPKALKNLRVILPELLEFYRQQGFEIAAMR